MRRLLPHAALLLGAALAGQVAYVLGDDRSGIHFLQLSVQVTAIIGGSTAALFSVGLILIYRANRIINFAHAGMGGVGAILMLLLMRERDVPYGVALLAGLATAVVIGLVVEVAFVRRFSTAPRLVLTVATIGIGQGLAFVAGRLPRLFGPVEDIRPGGRINSPLSDVSVEWFPAVVTGDDFILLGVTIVALAGMAAFFRFSSAGIAVRAAAENNDMAGVLGVNTKTLSSLVWVLAALLSSAAALSQVSRTGVQAASIATIGSGLLLRALAAAVVARMENLPLAVTASLSLAVFEASVFLAYSRTDIVDVVVLAVILGGLLIQRKRIARAEDTGLSTWAASEEVRPVPEQLAGLAPVRRGARWVAAVGAVLVLGYPWIASPSQTNLGSLFAIYGIVAVSLVVLIGWGGQVSLGQFAFVGVGALVAGGLSDRFAIWFPLAALVAAVVGAGVAVLLGLPALRIRGLFLAVTTLGFAVVTKSVVLNERWFGWLLPDVVERPTLLFVDTEDERSFYYLVVLCLLGAVWFAKGLRASRAGRVLIAMRDNERTAQAFGVNLVRTRLATFALSGFLAAFAGALFAAHQHAVTEQSFDPQVSINMFLMAVIGGLGSVTGVLLGPLYLGMADVLMPEGFQVMASAAGVLLVLLFLPGGLGGLAYGARDAFLRRVAIRNRIFVPSLLADYRTEAHMSKVPLAPKVDADGNVVEPEPMYELPSRIGVSGSSQAATRWSF